MEAGQGLVKDRPSPGVVVRTLQARDLDRLVKIDEELTGRHRRLWYEGKLKRALEETGVKISLGAEVDGVLAGALLGQLFYGEFGQPDTVAILDTILVDRAYARRGVGKALLGQALKNLQAIGIDRFRTEVGWTAQELIGFLARSGFRPAPRLVLEVDVQAAVRAEELAEAATAS